MAAIITDQIRLLNASNFVAGVTSTTNAYYSFIGLPNPTDVDSDWNETIQTTETETYDKCEGPSEFIKKLDKKKWRLVTLMDYTPKAEHPTSSGLAVIQKNE